MKNIITIFSIALLSLSMSATNKNAFSDKLTKESVTEVCQAVSNWQIDNFENVKHRRSGWHNGALYIGMYHWAEYVKDTKATDFLMGIGEELKWGFGGNSYHADNICVGQMYHEMYKKHKKNKMIQPLKERAFYVASHPSDAPLSKAHKVGKNNRWSWCDALFMAPPVYAALYTLTGEQVYRDYLMSEYKECTDSLYDWFVNTEFLGTNVEIFSHIKKKADPVHKDD